MNEDFLIVGGGALKSLSDSGKIGGHLILFDALDLDGEFFSKTCDFWLETKSFLPLIFDHGRSSVFGKKKLTHVNFEVQNKGLWIEGKLPIHQSAKVEALWEGVKADEFGLSSGTSGHLAERIQRRRGVEIVQWPLAEASLAKRPAQPLSRCVALKSLPMTEFDWTADHQLSLKQRVANVKANFLQLQHEIRMREFQTSKHADSRSEEQGYYSALAEIEYRKLQDMMRHQ